MSILLIVIFGVIVLVAALFAIWPVLRGRGRGRAFLAAALVLFVAGIGAGTYLVLGRPALAVNTLEGANARDIGGLIPLLVKRVHQAPDDVRTWTYLGKAYLTLGDSDEAAKAFARALMLDNRNAELYSAYGEALVAHAGGAVPPEAEAAFARALTLAPKDKAARYYLGFAFATRGEKAKAIALWQSLLDEAPANAPYRQELAMRIAILSRAEKK